MSARGLRRVCVAAASILLTLLVLEGLLEWAGYPQPRSGHQRYFVEPDAERGWRNVPGARGRFVTDEYDVLLEFNSRGIRGPERTFAKPAGTVRIVMLGDSFVEGYSVRREARVAEVLEALLETRDPGRRYEVIALGTAGYSTDQELLWLQSEGLAYHPDVVLLMFHEGDVWFNGRPAYWRGAKPMFLLEEGRLRLTNVPVPELRHRGRDADRELGRQQAGFGHWLRESKLYALTTAALGAAGGRAAAGRLDHVASEATPEQRRFAEVADELSVFARDEAPSVGNAWRTTAALLDSAAEASRTAGAAFLVFHVPFKAVLYPATVVPVLQRLGIDPASLDWEMVGRRLVSICRARGLSCIEPTPQFREAAAKLTAQERRLYYLRDNHWTEDGHRLAAELLVEPLLSVVSRGDGAAALPQGHR